MPVITLRTWPAAKDGAKRWAVQWERGGEYRREVFATELEARERYSRALEAEIASRRARRATQLDLALAPTVAVSAVAPQEPS